MVAHLKLMIAKMKHDRYGASSERGRKLLDQMELELEELEADAAEDAAARPMPTQADSERAPLHASQAGARSAAGAFAARAGRASWPNSMPMLWRRAWPSWARPSPRPWRASRVSWKVIQTVREKFACRACETITQPPAPFHPIARGRAGPNLLAMILDAKFGEASAVEPPERDVCPRGHRSRRLHAGGLGRRLHGDTDPAGGADPGTMCWRPSAFMAMTRPCRCWPEARRSPAGCGPMSATIDRSADRRRRPRYSTTRAIGAASIRSRHLAGYRGILQADAYAGFNDLYPRRASLTAMTQAPCWAHGRRNFFKLAELAKAPLAIEAVRRIDAIFDVEREINGLPHRTASRHAAGPRSRRSSPILEDWMRDVRGKLSRHADVAKAIDYMLKRWAAFSRFLDDGRICLTNNAAERALRGIALGRKAWLFAGSDRGGERAAAMYSLIVTAKLNDVDPRAWLADVLARIADHPASRLHELLPWNWPPSREARSLAA